MFLGQFSHVLDQKGRMALPKKLRLIIEGKELVLARGFEKCILGFERSSWEKESAKQLESPISDGKSRKLRRYMFSGAQIVDLDKIGRILIPAMLKEYAGIKSNVTIIGAGDHFEIWDEKNWGSYLAQIENENG